MIKKLIHLIFKNRTPYQDVQQQWVGAAIGAAASIISGILANKSQRNQQTDLYNKSRADNLADANSQNIYNSPQSQMQRLREAGLNPHLVYGNGNAVQSAAAPKEATYGQPIAPPDYVGNIGNVLGQYMDWRMNETQIDNMKAQKTVYDQDALLKASQTASNAMATARSEFELKQGQSLSQYTLEAAKKNVEKINSEIDINRQRLDINQQENLRAAAQNSSNLKEAVSRMLSMEQQRQSQKIQNAKTQAETENARAELKRIQAITKEIESSAAIKKISEEMAAKGIMPNTSAGIRYIQEVLQGFGLLDSTGSFIGGSVNFADKVDKRINTMKTLKSPYTRNFGNK